MNFDWIIYETSLKMFISVSDIQKKIFNYSNIYVEMNKQHNKSLTLTTIKNMFALLYSKWVFKIVNI